MATNESLTWSSADNSVATVGSTGTVTAIRDGTTSVTVAVGEIRATATVSVFRVDGSFMFTRWTYSGAGNHTADVLWWSSADSTLQSLPRPPNHTSSIASPAWSPDGSSLALEVISKFEGHQLEGWTYHSDLYVADAASPGEGWWRQLTFDGLSRSPSWSPDGTRIAFLRFPSPAHYQNDMYIVPAAGGIATRVPLPSGFHWRPRWSPDGRRLAFSSFMSGNGSGLSRVYVVDADGSNLASLTSAGFWDSDPEWSPDGTKIVFVRHNSLFHNYDLTIANAVDGGNVRVLTSSDWIEAPAWSPDGRQIMFSDFRALHVINADGSSLRQLTGPPSSSMDTSPAWKR
jgi:TolB protein